MHPSAYANARRFVQAYLRPPGRVVDVGSRDVNGSLRPIFDKHRWQYVGVDLRRGKNVDRVTEWGKLPFPDHYCDAAISSSALEHDPVFWLTFAEMVRITRPGGYVYICVPSQGKYHAHPIDCWRFRRDCWVGLAATCPRAKLVEHYIDPSNELWHDNVGIFRVS